VESRIWDDGRLKKKNPAARLHKAFIFFLETLSTQSARVTRGVGDPERASTCCRNRDIRYRLRSQTVTHIASPGRISNKEE
jgi:hypothetical protein